MQFRVEDEARRRKESVSNNEIGIVPVSKMREQSYLHPAGRGGSKQREEKKKQGDYYGETAGRKNTVDRFRVRSRFAARIAFLRGFTPSGAENSRLTGRRDANRVDRRYFGGLEGRRGENSCDYDRSCPTIDHQ